MTAINNNGPVVLSAPPFDLSSLEFGLHENVHLGTPAPTTLDDCLADRVGLDFLPDDLESEGNRTGESTTQPAEAIHRGPIGSDYILPPPSEWSHRPLYITSSKSTAVSDGSTIQPSVPFHFESELFVGTAIIRIATVEASSEDASTDDTDSPPESKQHRFQVAVQGRFKEPVNVGDVMTGQEFEKNLRNLPPWWMVEAGSAVIRSLSPSVELDLSSDRPRMLANLAGTAKELRADEAGTEPSVTSWEFEENSDALLENENTFGTAEKDEAIVTAAMRKRHLANPEGAASRLFYDTDTVYTFNFYQEMLDLETFSVDLGFTKLSIADSLHGQPIQVLAKTRDGRYLWSFQVWHEDLLNDIAQ